MNKKKIGMSVVVVLFVALIIFVGISINASHEKAEEEKKQEQLEKKKALDAKEALETNTKNAVSGLFENEKKTMLSDTYSIEDVNNIEANLKKMTNKKLKDSLTKDVATAKELNNTVISTTKQVNTLFKDSKEMALADGITRAKVDAVNKMVIEKTPQKKAQTVLENKVKKAYELLTAKEKASISNSTSNEKASNNTTSNSDSVKSGSSNSGSSSSSKSTSGSDGSNRASGSKSTSGTNGGSAGSSSNGSGNSSSSNSSDSNESQPTVAKMNLASRTNQIITVVANGSSAQVKFWEKTGGSWKQVFSTYGNVGSQGVGSADEYHSRTPRGAYSLGFAFGTSNPGTSLSFRKITNRSYWISNVNDSQYNTWQERSSSNKADERMASYPTQYKYGVVINYNTARTKGAGSGFFLHCSNGAPTAGCVAIPTSHMATVLKKLHSGAYIVNVNSESELLNY
ncbi:S-layer protein [Listeria monocytogenes]|uniref:toxin Cry1Ac domain D-VI-related protein n=1 Tax=Listeria monocytogenes TaxID=1639 RepID=UPI000D1DD9BB|nr:toxin Cry1Ac domain D-VI-related protein [Listeria monocytogenes]AVV06792.1 S-layer protein [Listeria monocytogenes]EAF6833199.1 S-layer protein [Listeria monocytogenes]EGI0425463.1 S-layer protein [Listeria monocytogenes]EGI0444406.1 S-layer protein [Listeria monocytogenes]EJJ7724619.1 S-layer protein [Listeria monocytogenes]